MLARRCQSKRNSTAEAKQGRVRSHRCKSPRQTHATRSDKGTQDQRHLTIVSCTPSQSRHLPKLPCATHGSKSTCDCANTVAARQTFVLQSESKRIHSDELTPAAQWLRRLRPRRHVKPTAPGSKRVHSNSSSSNHPAAPSPCLSSTCPAAAATQHQWRSARFDRRAQEPREGTEERTASYMTSSSESKDLERRGPPLSSPHEERQEARQ